MASLDKQMDSKLIVPGLKFKRKVYVLKKLRVSEYGEHIFVGPIEDGKVIEVAELALAQRFASRLQARQQTLNWDKGEIKGFVAADWDYIQIELVPEPEKIDVIEGLMYDDPVACIKKICELHEMYSNRIANWVRKATNIITDYSPPHICITVRPQLRWRGMYSPMDHTCHYVLPQAMLNLGRAYKEYRDYEQTIAHECVHAYQRHFVGQYLREGHGGDFYAMMKHAAMYPVTQHVHEPTAEDVKKCIALFRRIQRPMEKMAENGLLASMPCTFVTQSIKRTGMA